MQGKHRKKFKMRQANITKLRKYAKKQNKSKNAFLIQELTRLAKYLQRYKFIFHKGAEMTESQVKQMQEMQEAIARLTESNNNLVQNQQLAMLAIQELAERVKKLESKAQKEKR